MLTVDEANEILLNGDGVIASLVDSKTILKLKSDRVFDKLAKMAVVIVVKKGSAEIDIDYKTYSINAKNDNLVVMGKYNHIDNAVFNSDFEADCLVISRKFVSALIPFGGTNKDGHPRMEMPITNIIAMRNKPVFHLSQDEKRILSKCFSEMCSQALRKDAMFRLQILYVSVMAFVLELMNIIIPSFIGKGEIKVKDRKRDLVQEFSTILYQDFRKEHSVSYYADKLCVSAQYLSKSTRNVLGVSAGKVIEDIIVTEAILLLRKPGMSIQQIAQELGFSDQSSFGKFFKKSHGVSPLNYRKNP